MVIGHCHSDLWKQRRFHRKGNWGSSGSICSSGKDGENLTDEGHFIWAPAIGPLSSGERGVIRRKEEGSETSFSDLRLSPWSKVVRLCGEWVVSLG